jgi:hypothetical protein
MTIEEQLKEFEEKLRKQYELQEKLDLIHKKQGTAHYHNGSMDGSMIQIDLTSIRNENGVKNELAQVSSNNKSLISKKSNELINVESR